MTMKTQYCQNYAGKHEFIVLTLTSSVKKLRTAQLIRIKTGTKTTEFCGYILAQPLPIKISKMNAKAAAIEAMAN